MISFNADSVRINGPQVDGGYSITFKTGEYEQQQLADLMLIPQQVPMKVIVKTEGEDD